MRNFLLKIALEKPVKVIYEDGKGAYLERYFLFNFAGMRFYLHRIVGSDPDRGLHNHPWPWAIAIVLFGKYLEIYEDAKGNRKNRIVNLFNFILGRKFHRIKIRDDYKIEHREVWTLFIHRDKEVKGWGFMRNGIFHPHLSTKTANDRWEDINPKGKDYIRDSENVICTPPVLKNQSFYMRK